MVAIFKIHKKISLKILKINRYRYSKDDEEIYKEFMEIANELIPSIVKTTSGDEILNDPKCFGHILRFYDGLCRSLFHQPLFCMANVYTKSSFF